MHKVALVRGRHLNGYELQIYYPLVKKYKLTGFGSLSSFHDQFPFPVEKLPSPIDALLITDKMRIPNRYVLGVLNRIFIDSQRLWGLEEKLRGFDIAHVADTHYGFTYQSIQAKKRGYVKRVVATIFENIAFNNQGIRGRKEAINDVLKNLDHALAVSQIAKEVLMIEGYPEKNITVIPLGIDTKRFYPKEKNTQKKDSITILFVGRLEWYKGIYDVLDAFTALLKDQKVKANKIRLHIVGDGSQKKKLQQREINLGIEHHILHSSNTYDTMPKIYQDADIFIAPSKPDRHWEEQFSMALLEAQSSGLPIITTNSGAIPENVGNAAILVRPGDVKALTDSLQTLILNHSLRAEMGKKARERAVKYFDIQAISRKIDEVYKKILS